MTVRRTFAGCLLATALRVNGFSAALPTLTHVHDLQVLSVAEAKREYPIKFRAVVTYVDRVAGFTDVFVQDETAGVFIFLGKSFTPVQLGQWVEVSGVSTPGDFSPCVTNGRIEILGKGALPRPAHLQFDELLGAKEDGRWAELEGVVRSGEVKEGRLFLNVAAHGGTFLAIMPDFPKDWAATLVDAKLSLRGVIAAIFNDRRQTAGFRLFVPAASYIEVESPAPADPFALPIVPSVSVAQFRPRRDPDRRIHVRATVIGAEPGMAMYVSDRQGSLEVESPSLCVAHAGDVLDVAGFPGYVDGRPGLQDSLCRVAHRGSELKPVQATADGILPATIDSDPTGYGLEAGKKYDAKLVRIEGRILQVSRGAGGDTIVLNSGGRTFSAVLPAGADVVESLEAGSSVELTGVCLVTFDRYRRGQYFRILLRTPADIVVKARPPWWNLRHALAALCVTAVSFLIAITWILVLRRQVGRRTRQLRELSLLDPLTGIANRRRFDETLTAEFQRVRREGAPLSLLMIDIDHFKALNDSEGHQHGDACLLQVVGALQGVVGRGTDLVARYGGEEFAVILPNTNADGAWAVAESIRLRVEQTAIPNSGLAPGRVLSVSVGAATLRGTDERSTSAMVTAADRALYRAKSLGRNCTVAMEPGTVPICA